MPDITQTCRITGKQFVVTEWEQDFLKKFDVPLPTLCIEERHRRRLAQRNERKLYRDKCDLIGKAIISLYSEDKPHTVYSQDAWWGDGWDAKDYARDFDFSRPFFEQFDELRKATPRLSLLNTQAENSEFCNITTNNKNCYLVFGGDFNEDAMYSVFCFYTKDVSDLYWVNEGELVYDCVDCNKAYNLKYSQNSHSCSDSSFLFECRNCKNCFGCVNLNGKEYYIFNEQYSPEEYKEKIKEFRLDTWSGVQHMKTEFEKFKLNFPLRHATILSSENCTGDQIRNAKNCQNCFGLNGPVEDLKDVFLSVIDTKDAVSCSQVGFHAELFYEMLGSIESTHCALSNFIWHCQDIFYSDMCINSHDLFGCANMKRAQYCILNKQYSKEDYFALREKIVEHMRKTGEWGESFPMEISPWAYNETVANDLFPLSKEEVLEQGLKWREEEVMEPGSGPSLPDSIHDVTDKILKENLVCEKTGRPYNIIPKELKLYRQMVVPLPHFAPETRNEMHMAMRNPIWSWDRECSKCGKEIVTSIAPDKPQSVYCETCFLEEVY